MRRFRLARLGLVAALVVPPIAAAQTAAPVTVFIVRHAEKGPETPDPSLTREGRARAEALATMLRDARITTILVSQFKRTQETALPLAHEIHVAPEPMDAARVDDLVARLKGLAPGSRALVVTHSNLVPAIVEKLTGQTVTELTDADYDRLYIATLSPAGNDVLYLHFGAPSAATGGPMQ
jgi:broad specificity phosphatase PhoE